MNENRFIPSAAFFLAPPAIVACLELLWNTPFSRLPVYWLPFYAPFPVILFNTMIHIGITIAPVLILSWLFSRICSNRRLIALWFASLATVYMVYMSSIFLRLLWEIRDDQLYHPALKTITGGWVLALGLVVVLTIRTVLRSQSNRKPLAWPATLTVSAVIGVTALILRRPLTGLWLLVAFSLLICGVHAAIMVLTRGWRPSAFSVAAGLLVITFAVTIGRSFWAASGSRQDRPNIIVSLWDMVRPDRMSLYGYPRQTTPFAQALAVRGVIWQRAYSTANYTFPSHVSIFTGLYNSEHELWLSPDWYSAFSSLAGELAGRGYRTILISENPWVLGLKEGFDFYYAPLIRTMRVQWDRNPYRAIADPSFPTALTLASPFLARQVIDSLCHAIEGWYKRTIDRYQLRLVGEQLVLRRRDQPLFIFFNWMNVHNLCYPGPDYRTGQEIAGYMPREEYDKSLRYADRRLEELAKIIDHAGVTDRTIFILTSDHGQMQGEQNLWGHGRSLFDPVIQVPLLVSCSNWPGRKDFPPPVTQVTMKPMILAMAEKDYATPKAQGRMIDIMAAHRGVVSEFRTEALQENGTYGRGFAYIDRDGKKIIYDTFLTAIGTPWSGLEMLVFDLNNDPAESRNLFDIQTEDTRRLLEQHKRWERAITRPAMAGSLSRHSIGMEKHLRALGYLQ